MGKGGNKIGNYFKKHYIGFVVIFLIFFVLICIYPGSNLFTWIAARREIHRQERQIQRYQKEIMEMDSTIRILTTDRDSLEKFARENFHFAEKGEDVYLIDE